MAALYVVKTLDNKAAVAEAFQTRQAAKQERNRLTREGTVCVVSRGPDHPHGSSRVESHCLNTERTSRKRKRLKRTEAEQS